MKKFSIVLIILSSIALSSCKKDVQDYQSGGLLVNSSFEVKEQPSFYSWTGSGYSFDHDTPNHIGKWSLLLYPGDFYSTPAGFAETYITNHFGSYNAKLTCNSKASRTLGYITLLLKNQNGDLHTLSSITFTNTEWDTLTISTQITLAKTDKLIVRLDASYVESFTEGQKVLFDNVSLLLQ